MVKGFCFSSLVTKRENKIKKGKQNKNRKKLDRVCRGRVERSGEQGRRWGTDMEVRSNMRVRGKKGGRVEKEGEWR